MHERAIYMVNSFQFTRSARLGLVYRRRKRAQRTAGKLRMTGLTLDGTSRFILCGLGGKMGSFGKIAWRRRLAGMADGELNGREHNFRLHSSLGKTGRCMRGVCFQRKMAECWCEWPRLGRGIVLRRSRLGEAVCRCVCATVQ